MPSSCATRDRGGGVERVVRPGIGNVSALISCTSSPARSETRPRTASAVGVIEVDKAHVRLRVLAIGDDPAVLHLPTS